MDWHSEVEQHIISYNYEKVVEFYEQATHHEPDEIVHCWYLGLAYLLWGNEESAQATWLFTMAQGSEAEVVQWSNDLITILDSEADRQVQVGYPQTSLLIRHHLRDICPEQINNLLSLALLSIEQQNFEPQALEEWQLTTLLLTASSTSIDLNLLFQVLPKVIEFPSQLSLDFAAACVPHFANPEACIDLILPIANKTAYHFRRIPYAVAIAKFCLQIDPLHHQTLNKLSQYYLELLDYTQAIETAQFLYKHSESLQAKFIANGTLLATLMQSGSWQLVPQVAERQKTLLKQVVSDQEINFPLNRIREALVRSGLLFYQEDNLKENRFYCNKISQLLESYVKNQPSNSLSFSSTHPLDKTRRIKIGYIGHTFRGHSVGWLCRWIFQHHNRDLFEIGIYFINRNQGSQNLENPFFRDWFQPKVDFAHSLGDDPVEIAQKINADQVDILVDLDSTTLNITCHVMALKPAPIQVSWLGFDAPGLSTIDYFIADPYVLPTNAQEHYPEKIWRLPQTYIAVDGFEVDIPTLRREQLEIPQNSVIYMSSQSGMKRHPNTVRWQMQIIKAVPDSYFLIKGQSDQATIQTFFRQIAEDEGVDPQRLRFLPRDLNEFVHRANLAIADVVLDTYPYNGATTTLETLWMGIPLVTRVGEQFAARNSYTFMKNVGIKEGISWTDEEYVEWGVRLGQDEELRRQVAWKLKQSRKTSPLWNAKQFTREMEDSYQQMWEIYAKEQT